MVTPDNSITDLKVKSVYEVKAQTRGPFERRMELAKDVKTTVDKREQHGKRNNNTKANFIGSFCCCCKKVTLCSHLLSQLKRERLQQTGSTCAALGHSAQCKPSPSCTIGLRRTMPNVLIHRLFSPNLAAASFFLFSNVEAVLVGLTWTQGP